MIQQAADDSGLTADGDAGGSLCDLPDEGGQAEAEECCGLCLRDGAGAYPRAEFRFGHSPCS
jgi:hypothetical protein